MPGAWEAASASEGPLGEQGSGWLGHSHPKLSQHSTPREQAWKSVM